MIRVLVVDDSAFARKVVREVLSSADDIEVVGTARDGLDAIEQIARLNPDVVTLDLVMPGLDGLGVLDALPPGGPRVVVVSISDADSDLGITALQRGAIELVHKPTAHASDRLYELRDELVAKVRAAALARPLPVLPSAQSTPGRANRRAILATTTRLVIVGTSTGGPQALTRLVADLPPDLPVPVVLAVHIPSGYTEALARRLDKSTAAHVSEARNGMALEPGMIVLAQGGCHLSITGTVDQLTCQVSAEPRDAPHRPSIDLLFESAARIAPGAVLGVVLTGMGDDGTRGARAIRATGGRVISEDRSTCVIYGMPARVHDAGLSEAEVPLDRMAAAIVDRL